MKPVSTVVAFGGPASARLAESVRARLGSVSEDSAGILVASLHELTEELLSQPTPPAAIVDAGAVIYVARFSSDGTSGCLRCLRQAIMSDLASGSGVVVRESSLVSRPPRTASPLAAAWAAELVVDRLREGRRAGDRGHLHVIGVRDRSVHVEWLLPRAACATCVRSVSPPNGAGDAAGASGIRGHSLSELGARVAGCVGSRIGLIRDLTFDLQIPIAASTAWLSVAASAPIPTLGRARRYRDARTIAILEALERYAGLTGVGTRRARRAPLSELSGAAIDPHEFGFHSDDGYELPDFPYARYRGNDVIYWQAAVDLESGEMRLVPECIAFYGHRESSPPPIVLETSNGCAIGSSLTEAAVYGLLEVVERDALLMSWYRRERLPDVGTQVARDHDVSRLMRKIELITGMRFRIFDSSREHGIPTVVAVALNDDGRPPATVVSAGAGFDLIAASASALYELAGHCLFLKGAFAARETHAKARAMLSDSDRVVSMEDHGIVNALPEARSRFDYLLGPGMGSPAVRARPLQGIGSASAALSALVGRLNESGLRPLLVDHTVATLTALQLHACKVVVPGTVPMTFGHRNRRTRLPRLSAGLAAGFDRSLLPHPFM